MSEQMKVMAFRSVELESLFAINTAKLGARVSDVVFGLGVISLFTEFVNKTVRNKKDRDALQALVVTAIGSLMADEEGVEPGNLRPEIREMYVALSRAQKRVANAGEFFEGDWPV